MLSGQKNNSPRLLLARLRKGDYAHAGETEAIDIVLHTLDALLKSEENDVPETKLALDVGCGLGGTADYIQNVKGFQLYGMDIDHAAIVHAKTNYPKIKFFESDVVKVFDVFPETQFDIIYFFNVLYAIPNQADCLREITRVAKQGALLIIFDYTNLAGTQESVLQDLAGKNMHPLPTGQLYQWLAAAGWELLMETDLSEKFLEWYRHFLLKLEENRLELLKEFSADVYEKVRLTFTALVNQLEQKELGGAAFYARLTGRP